MCAIRCTVALLLATSASLPVIGTSPRTADDGQTSKWGDQGDGTYRNPILAADYSDPDVIRVGFDYYMVASTFESSPGVTVLHSRDLVNWESLGGAFGDLSQMGPDFNWDRMNRYQRGIFAPSIRYHRGKFRIFVNSYSGEGFYQASSASPMGPWEITQITDKNGKPLRTSGWTDPCPFWDDDGKAYLASSRPGSQWFSYLFQMTPDGTRLLDADADKMNVPNVAYAYPDGGTCISPFQSSEGNKIYKRNGYYYLQHIEFLDGGQGHGTYVFRSRNLYGTRRDGSPGKPGDPGTYAVYKFGPMGRFAPDEDMPGQGGMVDTPAGNWFLIAQFNRYGSDGRTPNLVPVTWIDDWPVPGVGIQDRHGKMVWQAPKPIQGSPFRFPQGSDEFDAPSLNPQWLWNHQPRAGHWSLNERPGYLRLHAFPPRKAGAFFSAADTICQRHIRSANTTATARLDLSGMVDGQKAGLAHFNGGRNYAIVGVRQTAGRRRLLYEEDGTVTEGDLLPAGVTILYLRSQSGFNDVNTYAYSLDGEKFTPLGGAYTLKAGNYRGDYVGIYTFNDQADAGHLDVDYFHYEIKNR